MVNGRTLEEELNRIKEYFEHLDLEQFERVAFDCGAGKIGPSNESMYVKVFPKKYANLEVTKKGSYEATFNMTYRETEAA